MRLLIGLLRIDQNFTDVVTVVIAQRAHDDIRFLVNQERRLLAVGGFFDGGPDLGQVVEVPLHFLGAAADTGGAHDNAHAFGHFELRQHLFQLIAVFAFDAPGHPTGPRVLWHRNQESAGQADKTGECGALVATLLFLDLHDNLLVDLEGVLENGLAVVVAGCIAEILLGDFLERQEAVALGAIIDKSSFEAGFDAGNLTLVDVRFFLFSRGYFDIEIVESLAIDHGHSQLFGLSGVD